MDNGHKRKKHTEVEAGMMETNIKQFLLTYGTPLIYGGPLHKYLGTPADTTSPEKLLPEE